MEEICRLFVQLPDYEQLQVLSKLQKLIKRDFVSRLPQLVLERVILFLTIQDVLKCTLVCSGWRQAIANCRSYWTGKFLAAGLSEAYVRANEKFCTSPMKCISVVYGNLKMIRSSLSNDLNRNDTLLWKAQSRSELFENNFGTVILYKKFDAVSLFLYVTKTNSPVVHECTFDQHFNVAWAGVWGSSLIVAMKDAEWIKICKRKIEKRWIDTKVISSYQTRLDVCSRCGNVFQVYRVDSKLDDMLHWAVDHVQLKQADNFSSRMNATFDLKNADSELRKIDALFLEGLAVVPMTDPETSSGSFDDTTCSNHLLLIQFNNAVVIYNVTLKCKDQLCITFQRALVPQQLTNVNPMCDLRKMKSNFRISLKNDLVGLIYGSVLFVWNLHTGKIVACIDLCFLCQDTRDLCLIAMGDFYCLLRVGPKVVIISTLTGIVVHSISYRNIQLIASDVVKYLELPKLEVDADQRY